MFGGFFRYSYSFSCVGVVVQSGFVLWVFLVKFGREILSCEYIYITQSFLVCGGDFIPQNDLPCKRKNIRFAKMWHAFMW